MKPGVTSKTVRRQWIALLIPTLGNKRTTTLFNQRYSGKPFRPMTSSMSGGQSTCGNLYNRTEQRDIFTDKEAQRSCKFHPKLLWGRKTLRVLIHPVLHQPRKAMRIFERRQQEGNLLQIAPGFKSAYARTDFNRCTKASHGPMRSNPIKQVFI